MKTPTREGTEGKSQQLTELRGAEYHTRVCVINTVSSPSPATTISTVITTPIATNNTTTATATITTVQTTCTSTISMVIITTTTTPSPHDDRCHHSDQSYRHHTITP